MITDADKRLLDELGLSWSLVPEGGWLSLTILGWPLPAGLAPTVADLLIRIPPGYPDMPLDMWYFSPDVTRTDGREIEQTQVREDYGGKSWQRWSRHLAPGDWRPGTDDLRSYLARLRGELRKIAESVAA